VPLKGKERKVAGEERKTVIQTQCVIWDHFSKITC
jgi:hypothetical protein